MAWSFERFIASRYMRTRKKTGIISLNTFISVAGVVVGVAALIIVLSLMNGFTSEIRNRYINMNAHLWIYKSPDQMIEDYKSVIEKIEAVPGVSGAAPVIRFQTAIRRRGERATMFAPDIMCVDPDKVDKVSQLSDNFKTGAGSLNLGKTTEGKWGVAVGRWLAYRLDNVTVGDRFLIYSPTGLENVLTGGMPKIYEVEITGVFDTGIYEFDNNMVVLSLKAGQKLLKFGDVATGISVKLDNYWEVDRIDEDIQRALGGYPFMTITWKKMNEAIFKWMWIEKVTSFIVLSLIVVVATFNIVSIQVMVVLEKTREIGILKSMGATSKSIRHIFLYQGLFVGILGTCIGVVVGFLVCFIQDKYGIIHLPGEVYIIDAIPVVMMWRDFLVIIAGTMFFCLLASVYPASKAASLSPLDAIHAE